MFYKIVYVRGTLSSEWDSERIEDEESSEGRGFERFVLCGRRGGEAFVGEGSLTQEGLGEDVSWKRSESGQMNWRLARRF